MGDATATEAFVKLLLTSGELDVVDMRRIAKHGVDYGVEGFTSTEDCVAFYEGNQRLLEEFLEHRSTEIGYHDTIEVLIEKDRWTDDPLGRTYEQYAKAIVLIALEQAAEWLEGNLARLAEMDTAAIGGDETLSDGALHYRHFWNRDKWTAQHAWDLADSIYPHISEAYPYTDWQKVAEQWEAEYVLVACLELHEAIEAHKKRREAEREAGD